MSAKVQPGGVKIRNCKLKRGEMTYFVSLIHCMLLSCRPFACQTLSWNPYSDSLDCLTLYTRQTGHHICALHVWIQYWTIPCNTTTVPFRPTLRPLWPVTTTKRWASLQHLRWGVTSWTSLQQIFREPIVGAPVAQKIYVHLFNHRCDLWQIIQVFSLRVAVTCDRRVGRNGTVTNHIWHPPIFKNFVHQEIGMTLTKVYLALKFQ